MKMTTLMMFLCLGGWVVQAAQPGSSAIPGEAVGLTPNLLRNGSFELNEKFNGTSMRQGTELIRTVLARQGKCLQLPVEGWWQNGVSAEAAKLEKTLAHSGSSSLSLNPASGKNVSVFSAPEVPVPAGGVTLSVWVRGSGVHGSLRLEFVPSGVKPAEVPRSLSQTNSHRPRFLCVQ